MQMLAVLHYQNPAEKHQNQAVEYFIKILEVDPNDAASWYFLGSTYMRLRMYNKAHDAYRHAVFRDAMSPMIWSSIGRLFVQAGQYPDALVAYCRAIQLDPTVYETWYELGQLHESHQRFFEAVGAYRGALRLSPANWKLEKHIEDLIAAISTRKSYRQSEDSSCSSQSENPWRSCLGETSLTSPSLTAPIAVSPSSSSSPSLSDEHLVANSLVASTNETLTSNIASSTRCIAKDKQKESSVGYFILSY
jgi:tetratricopeptide (TPR) repeat protein